MCVMLVAVVTISVNFDMRISHCSFLQLQSVSFFFSCRLFRRLEQVQQREQEDPDEVDEVPIEPDILQESRSPGIQLHREG